jgi:putative NADH-flavin reductase
MTAHRTEHADPARTVAVLGAAGHTGRFVVQELLRRGLTPIAVARDADRLKAMGWAEQGVDGSRMSRSARALR